MNLTTIFGWSVPISFSLYITEAKRLKNSAVNYLIKKIAS
jgi:hypothetical protein